MLAGDVCTALNIVSFPSLILFEDGEILKQFPERQPRTVTEFTKFLDEFRNPLEQADGKL